MTQLELALCCVLFVALLFYWAYLKIMAAGKRAEQEYSYPVYDGAGKLLNPEDASKPRLVAVPKPTRETIEQVAARARERSERRRGLPGQMEDGR